MNAVEVQPISISDLLGRVVDGLTAWANPRKATVKLLFTEAHLWEELLVSGDSAGLFLVFAGETPRSLENDYRPAQPRVDRRYMVVVTRGHGFLNPLTEALADTEPFYDSVTTVRDTLRKILNISAEFPVDYQGMEPLSNIAPSREASVFMDGFVIRFGTANDLPGVGLSQ